MLGALIKRYLDDNGIKYTFVADEIGVTENDFSSMLNGKRKITADEVYAICVAINVDMNFFAEKLRAAVQAPV